MERKQGGNCMKLEIVDLICAENTSLAVYLV